MSDEVIPKLVATFMLHFIYNTAYCVSTVNENVIKLENVLQKHNPTSFSKFFVCKNNRPLFAKNHKVQGISIYGATLPPCGYTLLMMSPFQLVFSILIPCFTFNWPFKKPVRTKLSNVYLIYTK